MIDDPRVVGTEFRVARLERSVPRMWPAITRVEREPEGALVDSLQKNSQIFEPLLSPNRWCDRRGFGCSAEAMERAGGQ